MELTVANQDKRHGFGRQLASMAFLVLFAVGCGQGGNTGDVSGKVTFKGEPVVEGDVTFFQPTTGRVAQGRLDPDGTYSLYKTEKGLPLGEFKVTVTPISTYVNHETPQGTQMKLVLQGEKSIPMKYRKRDSTPFSASITGEGDTFDFEME